MKNPLYDLQIKFKWINIHIFSVAIIFIAALVAGTIVEVAKPGAGNFFFAFMVGLGMGIVYGHASLASAVIIGFWDAATKKQNMLIASGFLVGAVASSILIVSTGFISFMDRYRERLKSESGNDPFE